MNTQTCCFFGHANTPKTQELKNHICKAVENLIVNQNVNTFLFGSKSHFNDLCLEAVTLAKKTYPHIKRIYVRAEYPCIDNSYKSYLLQTYDDTYYSAAAHPGKASYIQRNFEMIEKSLFCIIYFDEKYAPAKRKSGTAIAFKYALKLKREIINLATSS